MSRINLLKLAFDIIELHGPTKAAAIFGVAKVTVKNWQDGKTTPSCEVLQKVLDAHLTIHPASDLSIGSDKVLILMPILRSVEGKTFATIIKALADFGRDKVEVLTQLGTDIDRARCILADRALKTDAKTVVFIDSDAIVPCGYGPYIRSLGYDIPDPNAGYNAIARILSHGPEHRIVSCLAFGRRRPLIAACSSGFVAHHNAELIRLRDVPGETPMEPQDWVGMHFTRVDRSVFEEMRARADELFPEIKPHDGQTVWGYFIKQNPGQSEDGAFCVRAKKMGVIPMVDTALRVGHLMENIV